MSMITEAEQHTLAFLKEWLEWAEDGAATNLYSADEGLCCSSYRYAAKARLGKYDVDRVMEKLFTEQDRSIAYPFGMAEYWHRAGEFTQHQCPERLQWVKDTIAMLETKGTTDWPEDYEVKL